MHYMLVIHGDESQAPPALEPGTPEFEAMMAPWAAYNQMLIDGGHLVAGSALLPSAMTTLVDNASGSITDGPFVETKEQIGGFYLIEAADLDEAIKLARQIPMPRPIEVRPVADMTLSLP